MERSDVQGLVVHGYGRRPWSRFYRLQFQGDAGREWLRRVLYEVSSADEPEHEPFRFNVAFSASGLRALGLPKGALATFPREFVQGMAHPERSIALGDVGEDAPEHWDFGGTGDRRVDALALLYAPTEESLHERARIVENQLERFDVGFAWDDVRLDPDGKEHFGFASAVSQPDVRGSGRRPRGSRRRLAAGEFVLGYRNGYGELPESPSVPLKHGTRELPRLLPDRTQMDFGQNGSYLVLRKLEQRVAAFWSFAREAAALLGEDPERHAELCAARLIGRWPSGAPLALSPDADVPSLAGLDFSFAEVDPDGRKCPLGAHVRRANPRDMLGLDPEQARRDADRHRLIRRGRIYGPRTAEPRPSRDDGVERGLMFVAINASIRRQFEFVQRAWLNGSKFGGLDGERDPLLGTTSSDGERAFTVQGEPLRRRLPAVPRFVRVRGGEYFFLPGLRALNYLAEV